MSIVIAIVFLVVCGIPLAYAVTREPVVAVLLAPLVTGLQCTVAAVAMVVTGNPNNPGTALWTWLAPVIVLSWVLAGIVIRRPRAPVASLGIVDVVVMYGPLLLPALLVRRPPVAWDARSIWWFHAAWIDGGATAFRDALGNPSLAFSHADYPPLAPATVAGAWSVTGGSGLWVAQVVSTVLTLSAVAMLVYAVRRLVPTASPMVARVVALAVGLGTWAVADYGVAAGYVDHLWAAAVAGAVVLLCIGTSVVGRDRDGTGDEPASGGYLAIAVVLLAVAALTKNEGLVVAGVVAVVFTVRARSQLRRAAWVWVPVVAGGAWSVVARAFGASSDLSSSPRLDQLRSGDLTPLDRVEPTLSKLAGQVGWYVAAAALVSILGALALSARRRSLGVAPARWVWTVLAVYVLALVATYVISPYDLTWHLVTSIDRVSILVALLSLAIVASWVLVAVSPAADGSAATTYPDDDGARSDDAPPRSRVDAAQ